MRLRSGEVTFRTGPCGSSAIESEQAEVARRRLVARKKRFRMAGQTFSKGHASSRVLLSDRDSLGIGWLAQDRAQRGALQIGDRQLDQPDGRDLGSPGWLAS
jgi:hypothetical protein